MQNPKLSGAWTDPECTYGSVVLDVAVLDKDLARSLGMIPERLEKKTIRNAMGVRQRQVVKFNYVLGGREISTKATIADRSRLSTPMIIGKSDLGGFLIDPSSQFLTISGPVTEPR